MVLASHVVPFSGLTGIEGYPAFSPDGKQLVFVWNGDGGEIMDVYIKLIGAGDPVRLTRSNTSAFSPIFSPDSKQIAFFRTNPGTSVIYTISALGGQERKIAEVRSGGTRFSFSPDGKIIAVADKDSTSSTGGIFFVDVESGAKQRFTTPPDNYTDSEPYFSPDGKSIVFSRAANVLDSDLYIVSATDGKTPRRLTFDKAQMKGCAWTADGGRIIFSSKRGQSATPNLWQIDAAGGEPVMVATGSKNPVNPTVSPDGKTIAYVEELEDINIHRFNKPDPASGSADFKKFIASPRADHSQQFSPDGSKIVFSSARTGGDELWLANSDGSNLLQLTTAGGGSPRFSPDGKNIAFGIHVQTKGEIFVVSTEGGPVRRLTFNPAHDVIPAWSADGRSIYFTSDRSGELQIWKMAEGGGEARQITQQGGFESFESPDGKTLYFSKERGVAGLWSAGTEGGDEKPVTELSEAGYWRSWSVNQNGICYVARSPEPPYQIRFYNFSDRQTRVLASTDKAPLWVYSGLSCSVDGKTILYAQQDQNNSSIMLADIGK